MHAARISAMAIQERAWRTTGRRLKTLPRGHLEIPPYAKQEFYCCGSKGSLGLAIDRSRVQVLSLEARQGICRKKSSVKD